MLDTLHLQVRDFQDTARWRWVLSSATGAFLADHTVALDRTDHRFAALFDLPGYLHRYADPLNRDTTERKLAAEVGDWIAAQILGNAIGQRLVQDARPTVVVHVTVPAAAEQLLILPLDLAHYAARPLSRHGVSFVFDIEDNKPHPTDPIRERLRMLAVFSVPPAASPLNLRRERRALQQLVANLPAHMAVELRVLQFGVTRQALENILEDGEGWDIVHFSGHGEPGALILEKSDGSYDEVASTDIADLLKLAGRRLKLVTLSACLSAAATIEQMLSWLGLQTEGTRQADTGEANIVPAVARELIDKLGCAVLAMRYSVEDEFAVELGRTLYDQLWQKRQPLPRATLRALNHVLGHDAGGKPLALAGVTSAAAPVLFGAAAGGLTLVPPRGARPNRLPAGLAWFDKSPPSFVGRVAAMTQASAALAADSGKAGVLFHGMAGAGKTACAVELAWHHAEAGRFADFVWFRAPEQGREIALALRELALALERALPDLGMLTAIEDKARFPDFLKRLAFEFSRAGLLLVLDNLESLVSGAGSWRDERWGGVVKALCDADGVSRVVMTSRVRLPGLAGGVDPIAIHALPRNEALMAARDRPNLRRLMDGAAGLPAGEGRQPVRRVVRLVQGHPKMLELADGLAAEPATLLARLDQAEAAAGPGALGALEAFFQSGDSQSQLDAASFMAGLHDWTEGAANALPEEARLFFQFLCALEEGDRDSQIIALNWADVWKRLGRAEPVPAAEALLPLLTGAGLAERRPSGEDGYELGIHPGVAEAGRPKAGEAVRQAVDVELAATWRQLARMAEEAVAAGQPAGALVVRSGLHAFSYLSRLGEWGTARALLERGALTEKSPATAVAVLPPLRQVVRATAGTEGHLIARGVLARALSAGGVAAEAEAEMRTIIEAAETGADYALASGVAGDLANLLLSRGDYQAALDVSGRKADLTRRAGQGPWSQIADEARRLQILSLMGEPGTVLGEVEVLRGRIAALPDPPEAKDSSINVWNVRESLLNTGYTAALALRQWEQALALNAAINSSKTQRGAPAFDQALTRFNGYGPLLRLDRLQEAEVLLRDCQAVFEAQGAAAIYELGNVTSARAELESRQGRFAHACQFEERALRFRTLARDVRGLGISHFNLANHLTRASADPRRVAAHRLAALLLMRLMGSNDAPRAATALAGDLARAGQPAAAVLPDDFASLCATVDQVEGTGFRASLALLPRGDTDGDTLLTEAIAYVDQVLQQTAKPNPAADSDPPPA